MAPTNIWIAASDGNEEYVRQLISNGTHTPNDKDPNGYTPLHAATSYGHTDLLRYLLNNGGNITIADNDGDTLLHIVEDLKTAQMLIEEFNADWKVKNAEGQTPLAKLEDDEEFPELIAYFRSLAGSTVVPPVSSDNDSSATSASSLIDTLFCNPNVQLSYQNMPDDEATGQPLLSEEQFQEVRTIINGENAEEELTKYLTKIVGGSIQRQDASTQDSSDSSREKKQKTL